MSKELSTADPPAIDPESAMEAITRVRSGRDRWQVRPGPDESLWGPESPDWFRLEDDPRADLVKEGQSRRTWCVTLPDRVVYAKVFDAGRLAEKLKRAVGSGPAEREWRAAHRAAARGVPLVLPLALGVRRARPSRTVLLSPGVDGAVSLARAWEYKVIGAAPRGARVAAGDLTVAAARLLAEAHDCGFAHGDGHPSNILVGRSGSGSSEAVFVDLRSAHLARGPLPLQRSLASLAQLDQYLHRRATRTQRLRFWRHYIAHRASLSVRPERSTERAWLTGLAAASKANAEGVARTRDRRIRRKGKYFTTLSLPDGWRAIVVLRLSRRHVFPEPGVPDRSEADWRTILARILTRPDHSCGDDEALSRAGLRWEGRSLAGLGERITTTLQRSAHRRAFEQCHRLRHRDVPSELILAYAEHRGAGLIDATILIRATSGASSDERDAGKNNKKDGNAHEPD